MNSVDNSTQFCSAIQKKASHTSVQKAELN
jgi:hypothetical protein